MHEGESSLPPPSLIQMPICPLPLSHHASMTCAGSEIQTTKTVSKTVSSGAALLTTTRTTTRDVEVDEDEEDEEEGKQDQENQGYGRGHRPRRAFFAFGSQFTNGLHETQDGQPPPGRGKRQAIVCLPRINHTATRPTPHECTQGVHALPFTSSFLLPSLLP